MSACHQRAACCQDGESACVERAPCREMPDDGHRCVVASELVVLDRGGGSGSEAGSYLRLIDFCRGRGARLIVSGHLVTAHRTRVGLLEPREEAGVVQDVPAWKLHHLVPAGERIFIELMTSDRKLKASREGSK